MPDPICLQLAHRISVSERSDQLWHSKNLDNHSSIHQVTRPRQQVPAKPRSKNWWLRTQMVRLKCWTKPMLPVNQLGRPREQKVIGVSYMTNISNFFLRGRRIGNELAQVNDPWPSISLSPYTMNMLPSSSRLAPHTRSSTLYQLHQCCYKLRMRWHVSFKVMELSRKGKTPKTNSCVTTSGS